MAKHRFGALTGTAVALILAVPQLASAQGAPRAAPPIAMPAPDGGYSPSSSHRDASVPGSRPKPFAAPEATTRSRTPVPAAVNAQFQKDRDGAVPTQATPTAATPSAPASERFDPAFGPVPSEPPRAVAAPAVEPPPPPVAAAPVVAPPASAVTDSAIADKLRELVTAKNLERSIARKNERDAIVAVYQQVRNFAPLWVANGAPSERARDVLAHLKTIDADGLEPTDYRMPNLSGTSAEALAEAELKFTATLLTYSRHALTGRVHFSRVSPNIDYKDTFDPAAVLKQIAASNDLARTLDSFNPQQPAYKALKAKLTDIRNAVDTGPEPIPSGPVLRVGLRDRQGREAFATDARVPALRERLGLPAEDNTRYDRPLAEAMSKFQKANGLKADGQLTAPTIAALNGPNREQRLGAILATMERWRWMPRDLGRAHVMLNIPDYHLEVMNGGNRIWKTRVVVGKPSQATPLLTETMKFITVNPTWNVPQSIIYNELLPIYETSDPHVFDKMGLKVERDRDGDIRVFQPPGERNALGRIRFNFPNKFLVYQHDTPEKHYFAHDKRAYSHGCMRVQDPIKYAEVMLSLGAPKGNYTQSSITNMFGGEEKQLDFQQHIPVHITYQTAFVDDAGKLQFREDVYGLDAKLQSLLKGSERAVADVMYERPADPNFKPTAEHRQRMRSAASGTGNPFSLFEQLFR